MRSLIIFASLVLAAFLLTSMLQKKVKAPELPEPEALSEQEAELLKKLSLAVSAVMTTYFSSMWTLAYRQFTSSYADPDLTVVEEPTPA